MSRRLSNVYASNTRDKDCEQLPYRKTKVVFMNSQTKEQGLHKICPLNKHQEVESMLDSTFVRISVQMYIEALISATTICMTLTHLNLPLLHTTIS